MTNIQSIQEQDRAADTHLGRRVKTLQSRALAAGGDSDLYEIIVAVPKGTAKEG